MWWEGHLARFILIGLHSGPNTTVARLIDFVVSDGSYESVSSSPSDHSMRKAVLIGGLSRSWARRYRISGTLGTKRRLFGLDSVVRFALSSTHEVGGKLRIHAPRSWVAAPQNQVPHRLKWRPCFVPRPNLNTAFGELFRQVRPRPLIDELGMWIGEQRAWLSHKSKMGTALAYTL